MCRHTGDKWQSKTLFLSIFDLRLSIVDSVFDRQLKTPILSMNVDQKSLETELLIAICRQTGDKWQSKTLFLSIFHQRLSIVDSVFDCRLPGVMPEDNHLPTGQSSSTQYGMSPLHVPFPRHSLVAGPINMNPASQANVASSPYDVPSISIVPLIGVGKWQHSESVL